eukprot:3705052-Rhodomonas_salina.2
MSECVSMHLRIIGCGSDMRCADPGGATQGCNASCLIPASPQAKSNTKSALYPHINCTQTHGLEPQY